jgi:adenylate cyclase
MGPQEHKVERRLAAIFAADVAGYSRLMSQDEPGTLRTLTAHREIMDQLIVEHGGRIANTAGDSVLAEFPSAVDAVRCAATVQEKLAEESRDVPFDRRLQFRIGVHVGDVMIRGGDLLGDGVNIAARLESLAEPGGVCISAATHGYVRRTLPLPFDDFGRATTWRRLLRAS